MAPSNPDKTSKARRPYGVEEAIQNARIYMTIPLHQFLGATLASLTMESAKITFITTDNVLTPYKTLHASALYTALEVANIAAFQPHAYSDESAATVQHSVAIVSRVSGYGKEILVQSSLIKRSTSLAFFESQAYDASTMTLLATGKTIKAIRPLRSPLKL